MKKGLFLNNLAAQDSIYESGRMVFDCLKTSQLFSLDYLEISASSRVVPTGYDFYLFNYHPYTMRWLSTKSLRKKLGHCITMVLEVAPGDAFVLCPEKHFDGYLVLDPTIKDDKANRAFAFPRPLEDDLNKFQEVNQVQEIPIIGSFGFATKGKGFQHVVKAVSAEFDRAIVRINIPFGDFVADSKEYAAFLADLCKKEAKAGIEVEITHHFFSKQELIDWCKTNTLNCFLYDRDMPGLAATTDQAIVAGKPIAVSNNDTFRHLLTYLTPYPNRSLKEAIRLSVSEVSTMKNDWSKEAFLKRFEAVFIANLPSVATPRFGNEIQLDLYHETIVDTLHLRWKKYKRKLQKLVKRIQQKNHEKIPFSGI